MRIIDPHWADWTPPAKPARRPMSTARMLWILWCLGWAALWSIAAIGSLGLTLPLAGFSLLAILLPVGK